jgi:hypothetical protein
MLPGAYLSTDFVDRFLNTGFASTALPEVTSRQLNETFRAGAEFFRADIQEKMLSRFPSDTGYRPYGVEYSQTPSRPDEMESFSVTRCGHAFIGTSRCLFATDAPFDAEQGRGLIADTIRGVESLGLPNAELDRIMAGNARDLLRL